MPHSMEEAFAVVKLVEVVFQILTPFLHVVETQPTFPLSQFLLNSPRFYTKRKK